MTLSKRSIAAGIILAVVACPLALFVYLQVSRIIIRFEMEERLEKENLQTITIKVENIRWYEEDEELIVDNRLFDVKSLSIKNGFASVTGIFDDRETVIKAQIENLEEVASNESLYLEVSFLCLYQEERESYIIIEPVYLLSDNHAGADDNLLTIHLAIVTPPPKA